MLVRSRPVYYTHLDVYKRQVLHEDADFIRQHFQLPDTLERIAPILITQAMIEQFMRGQSLDLPGRLQEAYNALMFKKQFIVLEGTNTFSEASIVDLAADQVSEILQAPVLLIVHYRSLLTIDEILTSQRYFGDRLLGCLLYTSGSILCCGVCCQLRWQQTPQQDIFPINPNNLF